MHLESFSSAPEGLKGVDLQHLARQAYICGEDPSSSISPLTAQLCSLVSVKPQGLLARQGERLPVRAASTQPHPFTYSRDNQQ